MVLESNTLDVLFVKDGQQGEDGKVLYTWIKYAKDANGTGMTDDPNGAVYIGISYNNESSTESNDPTQYAWTKIQGADGKKGEDAYTIFLENENISFATDKNRNPLSEQAYTSGITIMKGAKPVTDFTIGDIAKTQGIAVAKTNTAITISVVNGNPLPNDSGEIEIPITVAGTVFKKILTWTCAKKGDQGEKGERGLQGIQGPQGIQGVAGKDGTNGKTTYFHIKYSSVANPTSSFQLTETPSTYIGTYVDFAETDSTDPKKYTWSQFIGSQGPKGEQGIAGVGVDGKTSYLHIAYANSADGKTGFSVSDSTNKSYIGQYTDFTPNDSTDYTKYSWSLIRGKDGIDGVSPTVSVTKNGTTTTITITDKNGTHTQTVKDGTDGTPGAAGKDGKTSYFHVKYSNDGGKTFTGNSGEDTGIYMGSYTDYTEADSTDVKKYNWVKVKGDKGDTGQKGQDGTSVTITSKSVTYQASTSGTTAPTGTWSTSVPTVNNGQYLWTKTTVQYSDGNKTEAYSVSYKGTNGTNGTSVTVSKTEVTYQVSTSGTTAPTGTWSTTMPSCDQGQYLWTKTYVKYSDGKETTSYSVSYKGVDGEKFAFNMLRETNQGSKHWVNMGASGKYSVESITTEDSINAVKLICTEPIASNEWQFCDFSDYEMLKSLKASTTYTLSYDIKTNRSGKILHNIKTGGGQKLFFANDIACKVLGNETWEHVSLKMTSGTTLPNLDGQVIYMFGDALSKVGYSIIKNLKLTEGIVDTPWAPHPEDLEGRGVTEITQWYLATNLSSGVTAGTSGWSTDITTQKITADKKYLWNCHRTKYSDGTMTLISTPAIIGVYGDKGDNAKNLTITPSSQYFKSTDGGKTFAPNAITIKATIQGEINFGKWQYSIDGGVSFADIVSGQKGLTINNNVLTVSKDSSLYSDAVTMVTFRAVASDSSFYDTCSIAKIYDVSDIGDGRNLWITRDNITLQACEKDKYIYTTTGTSAVCIGADAASVGTNTIALQTGTKYTISFVISSPSEVGNARWYFCTALNSTGVKNYGGYGVKLVTGENIVSQTITVDTSCDAAGLVLYHLPTGCVIKDIQVEKGSSPTGWTPAPEDVQTAILSTKSEISDVSLKVDKNKQAIEQRVEKTTYQQDLNLVKGDISKANEGLNKWRYEIYPKSLFASEYQGKSTMDVFAKNTNLTPSQSVLINDTDFGKSLAYGDNYIGYALTFVKFSAAKSIAITFKHDDGAHLYLNGKLIGGDDTCNTGSGESLTLSFIQGWNCLEVVLNEKSGGEYIGLGTTISAISECQLMNCYYGTPVARQSHITNQLVQNTTDIEGVTTTMQKVMTTVGGSDRIDEFVNNYNKTIESEKQFKKTIGETYTTKDEFNGLEIGGRNLVLDSKPQKQGSSYAVVSRRLSVDLQAGVTYTISFCGRVVDGDGSLVVYLYRNDWKDSIQKSTKSKENTVVSWQFTPKISGAFQIEAYSFLSQGVAGGNVYLDWFKVEKGNKPTDWTPAPEDNEINGQNLVSNLPSNWEQGTFDDARTNVGCDYDTNKGSVTNRICVKELVPVSGTITISNAYSNQSKKPIQHWITAFDVNKKWLGSSYVNAAWSDFPRIVDMKDAKYIAVIVKYKDESAITPSDISQICLKIERGTSATPFTLAPEDVNGKIVNVETIANQTAKKFEWIVKGGDKSSSMVLTDDFLNIVANKINLKGKVTFESLSSDAKSEIGKVAQSKVDGLEVGGRNLLVQKNITQGYLSTDGKGSFIGSGGGDQTSDWIDVSGNKYITITLYEDFTNTNNSGRYCEYDADKNCINTVVYNPRQKSSIIIELKATTKYIRVTAIDCKTRRYKIETGNKPTDWTPAPEDVSQDATNKASQALTDAKNYSSNAVNWVTNNGSSTTSLNSMVKKWTDGAVSDTAKINGGWIKANTITASKIALADFTNYSQLTRDTADAYGFTVTDDTDGTWFSTKNIKRDQFISEIFPCNGGESYLIEYDISTNAKGANNSTDTKNYIGVAIGVYGYTGTVGSNGLPNKATNILYADRITGSETAPSIHVKTTITTSTATKQFRVFLQSNGYYFEGTTKIRNLSVRRMYGGTLIVDGSITADKIATDAIKSRNYISSGGTQGSFLNLSDGSFTSPNLSWDSNGNLIAKNANLSGEITATNGSIAGWTIISNKMYTTGSGKYTGIGKYGSAYAFWAGATSNDNGNSAVFKVGHTGKLTATDADITGTITATNGKIGRYDITSTYLMTNSGSNASGIGGNQAFWAGAEDSNSAPFRVGYDGVLWAENAAIRGSIETGNLGDEGDTVSIINGHIGIQGTSNNVEIYSTGFKFGIDGDYYLMSVSEGVKCYRNLYATDFVADGWLYCSEVHSSGAVVIGADSESFYWAHGYQIARGTSWGGVCVGDDSQQLRLYGSSIWASHSISTSDENLKENFTTLDQYENFYMNLNPIGFNYIGDYDGKKTHFGFGAHKTEDVLESEGYDADKFAVVTHRPLVQEDIEKRFGKDVEVDIETEYGVSYTEFIALNTHMIQKTQRELTKVKQEKADLEVRLQAIEAKLGL